jgi:hypothetical protein
MSRARCSYKEKEDKLKVIKSKMQTQHKVFIVLLPLCVAITLVFHILGDNLEPLNSIPRLKCSAPDFEATVHCKDEKSCRVNSMARLIMAVLSLIFIRCKICAIWHESRSHLKP